MTTGLELVCYCRISDDRTGAGLGVERQLAECTEAADRMGMTIVAVYVDNDKSAFSGKERPDYIRLLADIRAGRIAGVISWHPDRLHRNPTELEEYIVAANRTNMPTYFAKSGKWELETVSGRLTARIIGDVAVAESEHKAERITAAHKQAAHRGVWRGGVSGGPFGYLPDAITPHPVEAELIAAAYQDVLNGSTLSAILRQWNAAGVLTRNGKPWVYSTLRQVLTRERNYGASVYRGQVVKEDAWPAIVSEDTWRSVVAILANPKRRTSASNNGKWLLAGLARCGICEAEGEEAVVRSGTGTSRGVVHTVYRCQTMKHLGRRAKNCDEYVTLALLAYIDENRARILAPRAMEVGSAEAQAAKQERRGVEAQIERTMQLWAEGKISEELMESTLDTLNARLTNVAAIKVDPAVPPALVTLATAKDPRGTWDSLSWRARREALDWVMTVTILPIPAGMARRFSAEFVRLDAKAS